MLKAIHSLLIVIMAAASAMEIKENCYECSKANGGNNYMCNYGGSLPTMNPYAIACCNPGDTHEYCVRSENNKCSPTFNQAKHNFFTYCPLINSTGCGLPNQKLDDMVIEVQENKTSTFKHDKLRYQKADWKFTMADVCYYQVQNPTLYFTSGKVFLTFTQAQSGVKLYLNAGGNVTNSTLAMEDYNRTVVLNKKYEIDQSLNFIITAIPDFNSYNTSFSFEYSTDGTPYPWYELYYYQWFVKHPQGMTMLYIAGAIAICIVLIFLCCLCVCIKKCCCRKKNQVEIFGNTELVNKKNGNDPTGRNFDNGSFDGEDHDALGMTDIEGPVLKKESKAKHEKEMRENYVDPFKPQNILKN